MTNYSAKGHSFVPFACSRQQAIEIIILLWFYYVIIMLLLCYYYVFIIFLYRLYTKIIMSVSKPHNTHTIPPLYPHNTHTVPLQYPHCPSTIPTLYPHVITVSAKFGGSTRGTRPDQQAPIDKTTHAPKRFFRLDNFIRSRVYQSLKAQQNT